MKSNFRDSTVWFAPMLVLLVSFAALSGRALPISQDIIEQAKKEGESVLDTTMPVGEFQIFNQAAKEKYPFLNIRRVRINWYRSLVGQWKLACDKNRRRI